MRHSTNNPSQRQLRVGEQLRHVLAEVLRRGNFKDEVLLDHASDVTVTEVRISPDLKNATAYVISLGGKDMDAILPALNDSAAYFQKEINRRTELKFTPRIRFRFDDTFDEVQRLDNIFSTLKYSDQDE